MARKPRVRHHVNPLGFRLEQPLPGLETLFADPALPLEVDVGCMHGAFLLESARRRTAVNFLGLEIRGPLVEEVAGRIARQELGNAAVLLCNANQSWSELFGDGSLSAVYVHFPDPWFKKRHHKRRVFRPEFLDQLARTLAPGTGRLVFMTDVEEYAAEVFPLVEAHPDFENPHGVGQSAPFVEGRVQTNREAWHLSRQDPVYRYEWLRRSAESSGS